MRSFLTVAVLVVAFGLGFSAFSVSLLKMNLVPDGAPNPPGDLLEIKVLFLPGEADINIEIRPFRVPRERNQSAQPLEPMGQAIADTAGRAMLRYVLPRDKEFADATKLGLASRSIIIPYTSLRLPLGTHWIAYEVTLIRNGIVQSVEPSEDRSIVITQKPRTTRERQSTAEVKVTGVIRGTARVVGPDGRVEERPFEEEVTTLRPESRSHVEKVNIPNGYEEGPQRVGRVGYDSDFRDDDQNFDDALKRLREGSQPWVPSPEISVYYSTNRNIVNSREKTVRRFGNQVSDSLSYGKTRVVVPVSYHRRGNFESGDWWSFLSRKLDHLFFISEVEPLSKDAFLEVAGRTLADKKQDTILYVHGFNNKMEFAILRFAQFIYDIRFPGTPVAFSWPSEGTVKGYWRDEKKAAQSYKALALTLYRLIEQQQTQKDPAKRGKIHLIAHSMGNRVLLRAIHELGTYLKDIEKPFGHIVLAAPDVDLSDFVALFPWVKYSSDSVSLYYSEEDKALLASQTLHSSKRLGQDALFEKGLINIDSTRVNTSLLGHDYFVSKSELLIDLDLLINLNLPPSERRTIWPAKRLGYDYWRFP